MPVRGRTTRAIAGAGLALAFCALAADEPPRPPRDIGLVERARRHLVQLDVSVRGPWEAIRDLGAEDFELLVNGERIESFVVDRLCSEPGAADATGAAAASAPEASAATAPPRRPPASFLFYFDQQLLTGVGRQNAIDLARRMVPELVRAGNRAAIVSSGKQLDTLVDLTDDAQALLGALDRLEGDREQWVIYPQQEETRIREVLETQENLGVLSACGTAKRFYMEEANHTDKALRLFALTLGHLGGLDPPKVVFYFADLLRRDAGEHYLSYVGRCSPTGQVEQEGPPGGFGAVFAVDRVIEEAAAQGIRVYAIRAEGLAVPSDVSRRQGLAPVVGTTTNLQRYSRAGDSLAGLALETGGRSFINGEPAAKIVEAVESDLSCMYLISFEPRGLPEDHLLRVSFSAKNRKVKAYSRGQIVVQSEGARRTSRLMSAFAAPGSVRTDVPLAGAVVPTDFVDGRYGALVQIRAGGSPLPQSTWDLGASLLTRGEVKGDASTRVSVEGPNVPVVFEAEMSFRPGPFELIFVAHEDSADQLGTDRLDGAWPVREDGPAITPIAVLQPAEAVFVRAGATRSSGALAIAGDERVRTDRPTALVALACRGPDKNERYTLERVLVGETETAFEPLPVRFDDVACAQFRDVIKAGTMTAGSFTYRARLLRDGMEVATAERTFGAGAPASESPAGGAP